MYEWLTIAADPETVAAYEKECGARFTAADRERVLEGFRNLQERAERGEDLSWLEEAVRCD